MAYPKQVYERAWRELERRRNAARDAAVSRREEIRAKIPEIAAIERKMAAGAAGITKAIVASPEKSEEMLSELRRENISLQERRAGLLEKAGYGRDSLTEKPVCEKCGDKGYTGVQMCPCLETLLREEANAYLSAMSPLDKSTFSNFSLDCYPSEPVDSSGVEPRKRMGEIFEFCMQYADSFTKKSESLLMLGQTGLGKTHLSLAIARAVTEKGFGVLYTPTQKLMDRLESEKFSKIAEIRGEYMDSVGIALGCDLLILDDLGTEFATSFSTSALYNIVNSRLVENLPTIINTNLEPQEIERRYSQRMVSRLLCEYRTLKFFGRDIRYMRKIMSVE